MVAASPDTAQVEAALFAAAHRGEVDTVLEAAGTAPSLLSAVEPVNKWTVLHTFARLSLASACERLIALGADIEARDAMFRSPMHMAARADASPSAPAGGAPPSDPAARVGMISATLRVLLKGGARVTARDQFGFTPLHHAAQAGHTDAVRFLLKLNTELSLPRAPIEAETNAEERPLHLAAAGGHVDTVKMLLTAGAHHAKTNYLGQAALHLAVAAGDTDAALATVNEMVQPNWRADLSPAAADGRTPLHVAAAGGHTKMVRALLRARNVKRNGGGRSVELHARDRAGKQAVEIAREAGFDDVFGQLLEADRKQREKEARAPAEKEAALRAAFARTRLEDEAARGGAEPPAEEEARRPAIDENDLSMEEYEARRPP